MSNPIVEKPPTIASRPSGIKTVLGYTGIPPSWLDKKPKLPSRNWLIFLSVTSSIIGLYVYDRRECKRIRQTYVDRVKHLSEVPIDPFDRSRKVTVYGAKWPADEEWNQAIKYFRSYVKVQPILVAAGVDYEMIPGKRHGEIAKRVAEDIRVRRRFDLGLDEDPIHQKVLPTYKSHSERQKRELEGGVVIIGRPTFKEYMAGLQRGWTGSLDKTDPDEYLSRILEQDSHFDEPEDPRDLDYHAASSEPSNKQTLLTQTSIFSPLQMRTIPSSTPSLSKSSSSIISTPPSSIPLQPPLLLVPFTNYIGIKQIPLMIWGFFNQRHKVLSGAQAGYNLVMNQTRAIEVPAIETPSEFALPLDSSYQTETARTTETVRHGDLDFHKEVEAYYKSSLASLPGDIEKLRVKYYEALPAKLAIARELARGTREPTKEELENPPPTEVELRAERLKQERRWREDVEGWEVVNPVKPVEWDERLRYALRIFIDAKDDNSETS